MKYHITYMPYTDTWNISSRKEDNCNWGFHSKVNYYWDADPVKKMYDIQVDGNDMGDALLRGQNKINEYIKEHEDPLVALREIKNGDAIGRKYDQCLHELVEAVLALSENK